MHSSPIIAGPTCFIHFATARGPWTAAGIQSVCAEQIPRALKGLLLQWVEKLEGAVRVEASRQSHPPVPFLKGTASPSSKTQTMRYDINSRCFTDTSCSIGQPRNFSVPAPSLSMSQLYLPPWFLHLLTDNCAFPKSSSCSPTGTRLYLPLSIILRLCLVWRRPLNN